MLWLCLLLLPAFCYCVEYVQLILILAIVTDNRVNISNLVHLGWWASLPLFKVQAP